MSSLAHVIDFFLTVIPLSYSAYFEYGKTTASPCYLVHKKQANKFDLKEQLKQEIPYVLTFHTFVRTSRIPLFLR